MLWRLLERHRSKHARVLNMYMRMYGVRSSTLHEFLGISYQEIAYLCSCASSDRQIRYVIDWIKRRTYKVTNKVTVSINIVCDSKTAQAAIKEYLSGYSNSGSGFRPP